MKINRLKSILSIFIIVAIITAWGISCEKNNIITEPVSIEFNATAITLLQGDEANIAATLMPKYGVDWSIIWNSRNPDIVSVDSIGKIVALEVGVATITATTKNNKTAACSVTVSNQAIKITLLDYSSNSIVVSDTVNFARNVAKHSDGTFHLPKNSNILKSITLASGTQELIGRKTDTDMTFQTNGAVLALRTPIDNYIPVGSRTEFSLMNTESSASGKFKLEADIDFMNIHWEPPANYNAEFDGAQHVVHNLKVEADFAGLWYLNLGYIHDFGIASGHIKGINVTGSICCINKGKIISCYNSSDLMGLHHIGGVCGQNEGFISNCHNLSNITGKTESYYIGGICAYNGSATDEHKDFKIINCHNTGNIKGGSFIGGICGYNQSTVFACYNTASVTGSKNNTGGVCGYSRVFDIIACCNNGTIKGDLYVGGISGETIDGSDITACYNTGCVTGNYYVGGLNGKNAHKITACYNIAEVYGKDFTGGICGYTDTNIEDIVSCYWKNIDDDNADYGIGGMYVDVPSIKLFDSQNWPNIEDDHEWGTGNGSGSGKYWKNLGRWDIVNAVYPALWFED